MKNKAKFGLVIILTVLFTVVFVKSVNVSFYALSPKMNLAGEAMENKATYSNRTIIISVDQKLTKNELHLILEKYNLTVMYDYKNFNMYALQAEKELNADEMDILLKNLEGENHIISAIQDGIAYLD